MARYKYTGNKNPVDYTNKISVGGKDVELGGEAVELTEAQYNSLKDRYVLEREHTPKAQA